MDQDGDLNLDLDRTTLGKPQARGSNPALSLSQRTAQHLNLNPNPKLNVRPVPGGLNPSSKIHAQTETGSMSRPRRAVLTCAAQVEAAVADPRKSGLALMLDDGTRKSHSVAE